MVSPRRGRLSAAAFVALVPVGQGVGAGDGRTLPEEFAEAWRWAHFTTEDGLPSNQIIQVIEVGGTPWVATRAGLAAYDGWRWIAFGEEHGLPATAVETLSGDSEGALWVGFENALFRGGWEGFTPIELPTEDGELLVRATVHPQPGLDLVLVEGPEPGRRRLLSGDPSGWKEAARWTFPRAEFCPQIWQPQSGRVWLEADEGYHQWWEGGWRARPPAMQSTTSRFAFAENKNGNGVAGIVAPQHALGLWSWGEDGVPRVVEPRIAAIPVCVAVGPEDEVLVTYDSGAVRFREAGEWSFFSRSPDELDGATFLGFRENGDLWVGSDRGLRLLSRSSGRWTHLCHPAPEDPRNRVNEMLIASDGRLWLATGGGVEACCDDKGISVPQPEGRPIDMTGLAEDERGVVWFSSGGDAAGIWGWDGRGWTHLESDIEGRLLGLIHKIRVIRDGSLWLLGLSDSPRRPHAEDGAIYRLVDGRAVRWEPGAALAGRRIYDVARTKDGALWFATSRGISRLSDGAWRHWGTDEGVEIAFRVIPSESGVWIGHPSQGLYRITFDGDVFVEDLGSPRANQVWDFALDGQGALWITTVQGVVCLYPDGRLCTFEQTAGLRSPRAWPVLVSADRVYVGTIGGGTYILNREASLTPPPRAFLQVQENDVLRPLVRWSAGAFWGELAAADVLTRWRVDAGAWSPFSTEREVVLAELDPGTHRFEVQGQGLFGALGEPAEVEVSVRPPLLRRAAFVVPVAVLSAALLALGLFTYARRRRDAAALRASEAKHRAVMEQASDAILVCDEQGRCISANSKACKLLGSCAGIEGRPIEQILETEDGSAWLAAALAGDEAVVPLLLPQSGSERLVVEASLTRLGDGRVLAIVRDLTERRRLEQERLAFERQLTETQKLESLGRLAGGFAHDFNNLLMLILGHADQAIVHAEDPLASDDATRRDLTRVVEAAQRAGDLTEKLLAFAGREPIEPRAVDLNALLLEVEDLLQTSIGRGVGLRMELAPDLPAVEGDPGRLRQVVLNLVVNASEALEGGRGQVTLRTRTSDRSRSGSLRFELDHLETQEVVVLDVIDDGPGMEPATRARAFEPFFTTRFQGRGLGLAAVRGIVRSHRGALQLESEADRGTRVTVLLPIHEAGTPAIEEPRPELTGDLILVVDDEPGVCQVVAAMLERAGVRVLTALGGREALELFQLHGDEIAASIVDVTMPDVGGIEVRARMLAERPDAIVHLMSGYSEMVAPVRDSLGGQTLFLRKPFSAGELLTHMRLSSRRAATV